MVISSSGFKHLWVRSRLGSRMLWRKVRPRSEELAVAQARQADFANSWNERCWAAIEYHRLGHEQQGRPEPGIDVDAYPG